MWNILSLRTGWRCITNLSKWWNFLQKVSSVAKLEISLKDWLYTQIYSTQILRPPFRQIGKKRYKQWNRLVNNKDTVYLQRWTTFEFLILPNISDLLTFPRVFLRRFDTNNLLLLEFKDNCSSLYRSCRKSMISVISNKSLNWTSYPKPALFY